MKDENERDRKLESRRDVCEVVLRAGAEVVLRAGAGAALEARGPR